TTRASHFTVTLNDGRVVVVGGYNGATVTAVDLFDPATMAFTPRAPLPVTFDVAAAALLADGTVLATAGRPYAWVYQPTSGTWSSVSDGGSVRAVSTATLLPTGRVLLAGGWSGVALLPSSDFYAGWSGRPVPAPPLPVGHRYGTLTVMPDGSPLLVGG